MNYEWNDEKNALLRAERGFGFEDILAAIDAGGLLDNFANPNQDRYPGQRILVVMLDDYVHAVPCVQNEHQTFLKTAYPSRQLHRQIMEKLDG